MTQARLKTILFVITLSWFTTILYFINTTESSPLAVLQWSVAQLLPSSLIGNSLQKSAWEQWNKTDIKENNDLLLEIPTVDLTKLSSPPNHHETLKTLEATYGKDWRDRPLLLQNLWSKSSLQSKSRHLSLSGLLQNNLSIPYFTDATTPYALTPDAIGPASDIVYNMTKKKYMHKFGTQLIVQNAPELIEEVVPQELVTALFGNYFEAANVVGSGPLGLFPALTTVPVFVANTVPLVNKNDFDDESCSSSGSSSCSSNHDGAPAAPRTELHCEPIGNVAVQLEGKKQWTLISPKHSFHIQPAASPDGRAFFASYSNNLNHVPRYELTLGPGDALWVPTWWWHRVDYVGDDENDESSGDVGGGLAIGSSVFHFRVFDFVRYNPLFATLIIPALIKEVVGYSTQ